MFRDEPIKYPDNNPVLGRFLGPEIDVGPEMTANIMKGNGEVVHLSSYHELKEYCWINQAYVSLRKEFDRNIKYRFGLDVSPDYFTGIN